MKKQVYNPYLPIDVCIPDGEPHVFGDRVYLYGSHDKEGGDTFCMLDYTVYSAPVDDLSDWRCEGVIYRADQDPDYQNRPYMYAPDVVRGNDGRYYLYYCMSGRCGVGGYHGPISVAVCDTPAGKYEYLGFVKNRDGSPMQEYVCFDPGVINDEGVIRLYSGTQYDFEEKVYLEVLAGLQIKDTDSLSEEDKSKIEEEYRKALSEREDVLNTEQEMFGKSREQILGTPDSIMGPVHLVLEDDMLTVKEEPRHIIPYRVKGTDFEEHPFFEASSIRKIGDTYYFIYSSQQNHELCYATSRYPDREFRFGGTIVSNGDVGMEGRKEADRLNMTGTTHGSIEKINGQWYVFYHRLTHKSDYSRQACAEKIMLEPDGSIRQVEITSCGLNGGALKAEGTYPAVIACNITNGHMPHGSNKIYKDSFPNCTHQGEDRFIGEISDWTLIGYKYFEFARNENVGFGITYRSTGKGTVEVCFGGHLKSVAEIIGPLNGAINIEPNDGWTKEAVTFFVNAGIYPLYLRYRGSGQIEIKDIFFGNSGS